ncbi:hypothetical protein GC093_34905 [Paenibacillus sp. LMG 31456]|uniref:Histidine kinase domain-containing protein n=1 Tax=Paenibacillus foliorum TaxID=2654974 RepID=A0A972H210_9BACL|nr:ATP-binding protein [Paenibacillus foliorum]NOU98373.1 hypothetical protein [Paenibacillus foliorum]
MLLIVIHGWFAFITFQYPFIGILLTLNENNEFVIRKLDTDSASLNLNFQVGDIVRQVNDEETGKYATVKKWRAIEQADSVLISRNGEEFRVVTEHARASASTQVLPLLGEILCVLFAAMVYWKVRNSKSGRFLSLVFLNIGFIFASLGASVRGDALGKMFISTSMILFPVMFFHFLVVFLREKGNVHLPDKFMKLVYGIVLITVLPRLAYFFPDLAYYVYQFNTNVVIALFLIVFSFNFLFLTFVYLKYRNEGSALSAIVKTVWWSLIISFFPFACLSFIPQLFLGYEWVSSLYTSWLVLVFPISFAYLIVSKQLYDIDIVLRRIVFTVLLSIVPSAAISALNTVIFQGTTSVKDLFISFIFSVVIISSVLYSYEYFTTKLQKIMFPRKYHLQNALRNIATNLRSISSFRELKDIILVDIVNTLEVSGAAIVFKYNDSVETVITGDIQADEVERMAVLGAWGHPSYSCMKINRHEEYTSYMIIARKKTNTLLGQEETQWLNLIISYLAVSLENLHLIGKLNVRLQHLASQIPNELVAQDFMWFRKLMFELQESERKRIATDLHDTTLQDLFFLKKRFTAIMNSHPFEEEEMERMSGIIDYVEIINTNLRQSCFELNPHLLHEIGLLQTVTKVVEQEGALLPFQLEFSAIGAEMIESWDMETKRHVFRIIQELINNAKKHSEASRVSILITKEADSFQLLYEDDGIGFIPKPEVEKHIGASGMGMEQMKSRVLHLNGHLEISVNRGSGTTVWITLPLRRVMTA